MPGNGWLWGINVSEVEPFAYAGVLSADFIIGGAA
jgi:hypothetical protein